MASVRAAVGFAAIAAFTLGRVNAVLIPMTYCATINTASMPANSSIYQSDGLCRDFCTSNGNAFAVIKDSNCWCSDYTPSTDAQVNSNKCNKPCPGFPEDTCGGDGVWGYIKLSAQPSGVKGGNSDDSSQTTEKTGTTGTTPPVPVITTPIPQPSPTSTTTSTRGTSKSAPPNSPNPPNSPTNTATTPLVVVSTVTANGGVSQVTITLPASSGGAGNAGNDNSSSGGGLTTGAAVGIAIGTLAVVGIAIAAGVWFWFKRRRQQQEEAGVERSNSGRDSSAAGMMGTPRTEMASIWDSEQLSTGRRNSRLMPHDPRMDPFAGNIYAQANKSRESVNTLQDNQDYSRKVLRTTNPDPDDD